MLSGLAFGRLIQNRLEGWKQDRLAPLPLGSLETGMTFTGIVLGITLFIGASLSVFGFSLGTALPVQPLDRRAGHGQCDVIRALVPWMATGSPR